MPWLTFGGYAAAAVLGWLWLEARDDLAAQVVQCNADKLSAIAEAEKQTRELQQRAYSQRIAELERNAEIATEARVIAERAAREAENRPEVVRTIIRREADSDACIDSFVPGAVVDSLRN